MSHNQEPFLITARRQLCDCAVPTLVAIAASVVISKLGVPVLLVGAALAIGYAYWLGYRIRLVKPNKKETNGEA